MTTEEYEVEIKATGRRLRRMGWRRRRPHHFSRTLIWGWGWTVSLRRTPKLEYRKMHNTRTGSRFGFLQAGWLVLSVALDAANSWRWKPWV